MKGQLGLPVDVNPLKSFPHLTVLLILVNVIVYAWSSWSNLLIFPNEEVILTYGLIPLSFSIITIITSMFLHGGLDHIFGNMWYLWIFGDNVEDKFGKLKFLLIYFASGLAATFTHYITNLGSDIPAVGASGAISGILGAYLALFPHARVRIYGRFGAFETSAYFVLGFWFVIQLIFGSISLVGASGSGIAFWAHIGGFVFGYVVTKLMHL